MVRLLVCRGMFVVLVAGACRAAETSAPEAVPFNNLTCPVSGQPAKTAHMGVYNGVVYRFCCAEHVAEFQKKPQRYLTNLPNNGVIIDLQNEICPVTGQPAGKDTYIVINGTRVHAKCAASMNLLRRFPAQYLERAKRIQGMTPEQLKKEFTPVTRFNNRLCPVTGQPAHERILAVHSNIVYRFSSIEARAAFTNAPLQYLNNLPNNGQIVDMGNDFCPDAGDPVSKKLFAIVDGYKIYAGCATCVRHIYAEPERYIARVKELMAMAPGARAKFFAAQGGCSGDDCPSTSDAAAAHGCSSSSGAAKSGCAGCPNATGEGGCKSGQ